MNFQTIKEALNTAIRELEASNIDDAKQNVNLIAAKALNISYTQLPLHWNKPLSDDFYNEFQRMLKRRLKHEPLQYILGEWCFLDFDVNVSEGALIPRPETEEVFLAAVEAIKANFIKPDFKFADVGTGTGVLGIAMTKYFPKAIGYLVDISDKALEIAKSNLLKYSELLVQSNDKNNWIATASAKPRNDGLKNINNSRVSLMKSDLLETFQEDSLEVIISNPPYIDSEEVKTLMPEVVDYEPHIALDGGKNGLVIIDKLLKQAEKVLKNRGLLIFEHGHGQRKAINDLLYSSWKILKEGNDFAGKERYFILQLSKATQVEPLEVTCGN